MQLKSIRLACTWAELTSSPADPEVPAVCRGPALREGIEENLLGLARCATVGNFLPKVIVAMYVHDFVGRHIDRDHAKVVEE